MRRYIRWQVLIGLVAVIALALSACGSLSSAPEESGKVEPTPTAQQAVPTATPKQAAPTATPEQAAPTPLPKLEATSTPKPARSDVVPKLIDTIGIQSAMAFIDKAGFHAMEEALQEAKEIKPSYASTVRNVMAVTTAATWPKDISEEYEAVAEDLKKLESALAKNDVQAAAEAAESLHETEHDLSKAFYGWMAGQKVDGNVATLYAKEDLGHYAACVAVKNTVTFIDGIGFHEMEEELTETNEIKPGYASTVRNVMTVAQTAPWPKDISEEYEAVMEDFEKLDAALAKNDVQAATEAAESLHETQHDLSKAFYGWYGSMNHSMGMMGDMMHASSQSMLKFGAQSSMAFLDGIGFHDMEEELSNTKEIKASYASTTRNAMIIAKTTIWPKEVSEEYEAFMGDLQKLDSALGKNDVPAATEAAEALHETQHDLSKALYGWMGAGGH